MLRWPQLFVPKLKILLSFEPLFTRGTCGCRSWFAVYSDGSTCAVAVILAVALVIIIVVAVCEAVGLVSRRVRCRWRMVAVRKGVEGPLPCSTL